MAVDETGDLFILESFRSRIRKVDAATGIITTVAGGQQGFSGDGGPATEAALNNPAGVAVDGTGHLFIADGDRIRRVDAATGIITTVAGTGESGFSGDGGPATEAVLNFPNGLAIDQSGNLFISDFSNLRIRKVDATTGIITTEAILPSLSNPFGVAVDRSGSLFVSDYFNHRILKVDGATGIITTVAGTGCSVLLEVCELGDGASATEATVTFPTAVALDGSGILFITDSIGRIRAVPGIAQSVAPPGVGPSADPNVPPR